MAEESTPRGERTQAEIIRSAHHLFLQNGYHGTSMRQIAKQAGIALGGIYNHFSSKDEIFKTVFLEYHPYKDVLPLMIAAQGRNVDEFVRDAAGKMVGGLNQRLDFLNLFFIEMVEFKGQHMPELVQIILPDVLGFAQRFLASRGELRSIPIPMIVRAFIGLFFSYYMTELLISSQLPTEMRESALEHFVDIYLHGILVDGATGAAEAT